MRYIIISLFALLAMSASCNQASKGTTAEGSTADQNPPEKSHFDKTISKEKLTMVDFYTTWCRPCKMMAPFVERVLEERAKDVSVLSIDAEKETSISGRYNITAYPTLIFFRNGKEIHREVGFQDLEQLNALVDKLK